MKGLSRVVIGSAVGGLLGAAAFFAIDGLMPKAAEAQYPGSPGYYQNDYPGSPGYVQDQYPGSSGYIQRDYPGSSGYVQDKGVFGF